MAGLELGPRPHRQNSSIKKNLFPSMALKDSGIGQLLPVIHGYAPFNGIGKFGIETLGGTIVKIRT